MGDRGWIDPPKKQKEPSQKGRVTLPKEWTKRACMTLPSQIPWGQKFQKSIMLWIKDFITCKIIDCCLDETTASYIQRRCNRVNELSVDIPDW